MTLTPPMIDPRNEQKLAEQVRKLAIQYCPEWKDLPSIEADKQADALIHIFSRMMELVIQRLNKVPDKNFLNFLDMAGVRLLPPRVARAPVTFTMTRREKGEMQYGSIPAGTQIATEGGVIYETEKELTVITPELKKMVSLIPGDDMWTDHSPVLIEKKKEGEETLFKGNDLVPHRIYLGHEKLFGFKEATDISLHIEFKEPMPTINAPWEVKWYYYKEGSPDPIPLYVADSSKPVANLLKSDSITFGGISGISKKTLKGIEKETGMQKSWINYWIFAELKTPLPNKKLPEIGTIRASVIITLLSSPGTGTISSDASIVTGDKTAFIKQLKPNDSISAAGQTRIVMSIDNDRSLTIDSRFDPKLPAGTNFTYSSAGLGTIAIDKIKAADGKTLKGNGTIFKQELKIGEILIIDSQNRIVTDIISDTELRINRAFSPDLEERTPFFHIPPPPVDIAYFNNFLLDITKDFHPFGEKPKFNDTFYIGSKEVFSKTGADITINVVSTKGADVRTENIELIWEFWDGKGWVKFGETTYTADAGVSSIPGKYQFTDSTNAFKNSGLISFKCPNIEVCEVNGEKNNWIRVRIFGGNYGEDTKYETRTAFYDGNGTITSEGTSIHGRGTSFTKELIEGEYILADEQSIQIVKIKSDSELTVASAFRSKLIGKTFQYSRSLGIYKEPTFKPPFMKVLTLFYDFKVPEENLDAILAYNDFSYQDYTEISRTENKYFAPFQPVFDKELALYLAFDRNLATLPVTLFFPLLEKIYTSYLEDTVEKTESPSIVWEYWDGITWNKLKVEDHTENLTRKELVQFRSIPSDIEKRDFFDFGTEYYWIRARLEKGIYKYPPELRAIHTNTIWAHNHVTVKEEKLGSGNGKPGQVLKYTRTPVMRGQKILVKELSLIEEDKKTITFEEGKDAIKEILDNGGSITGYWVCWHEMDHFYFSKPNSRHYIIDRNKGEITFGDGNRGMIPPVGKDNIVSSYVSGGGKGGNVGAGKIVKLRTTFPYIKTVTNHEAAEGGENKGDLDRARVLGPQTIKHRDRAVTYEDFEWLAKEASPKVAKAKCLPATRTNPGRITMIIVPQSDKPKPLPTQELIGGVREFLCDRTASNLAELSNIKIIGPGYIQVSVTAKVRFIPDMEVKTVEGKIIENLSTFFHPLRGGPEGKGWDFGRNVYISEVYEVIEKTDGVDYVERLFLDPSMQIYRLKLEKGNVPSNQTFTRVKSNGIVFSITESISDNDSDILIVTGFKEGDHVKLTHKDTSRKLVIRSVFYEPLGDVLECEPYESTSIEMVFPKGSIIETLDPDKMIKSYILNDNDISIKKDIIYLKIDVIKAGDEILLGKNGDIENTESLYVKEVDHDIDTIFIDKNYLVYSGTNTIYSGTDVIM